MALSCGRLVILPAMRHSGLTAGMVDSLGGQNHSFNYLLRHEVGSYRHVAEAPTAGGFGHVRQVVLLAFLLARRCNCRKPRQRVYGSKTLEFASQFSHASSAWPVTHLRREKNRWLPNFRLLRCLPAQHL
jgi:hypothetical protein